LLIFNVSEFLVIVIGNRRNNYFALECMFESLETLSCFTEHLHSVVFHTRIYLLGETEDRAMLYVESFPLSSAGKLTYGSEDSTLCYIPRMSLFSGIFYKRI
jgi:hypothetical protein